MLVRSLIFNLLLYVNFIVQAVAFSPVLLLPERYGWKIARFWSATSLWLHRTVCGIDSRVVGAQNAALADSRTGCLVACKHQSAWETIALVGMFDRPAFVYKRQLGWLPLFGWYLLKLGSIPVDRGKRSKALDALTIRARKAIAEGRQVVIFPEGTRRPAGATPNYRYGVTHLYAHLQTPCIPVALNSGLFWPRRSLTHRPGTITAQILPAIPPGLPPDVFSARLRDSIESATGALIAAARTDSPQAPAGAPDHPGT